MSINWTPKRQNEIKRTRISQQTQTIKQLMCSLLCDKHEIQQIDKQNECKQSFERRVCLHDFKISESECLFLCSFLQFPLYIFQVVVCEASKRSNTAKVK